MKTFNLPDLGEGLSEAEVVTWHVSPGDHVVVDQPLVSVETDKAVVEVPSPYSGTVAKLHAAAGTIVGIGKPLVDFDDTGAHADKGTVVGSVPAPKRRPRNREKKPLPRKVQPSKRCPRCARSPASWAWTSRASSRPVPITPSPRTT
jgi:pyruvate dehydrogenase E2 component (dihydrolipoamide acetyltransferase)